MKTTEVECVTAKPSHKEGHRFRYLRTVACLVFVFFTNVIRKFYSGINKTQQILRFHGHFMVISVKPLAGTL